MTFARLRNGSRLSSPSSKSLIQVHLKIFSYNGQLDAPLRYQVDDGSSNKQHRTVGVHDPTVSLERIWEDRVQRFIDAKNVADANEHIMRYVGTIAAAPRIENPSIFAAQ